MAARPTSQNGGMFWFKVEGVKCSSCGYLFLFTDSEKLPRRYTWQDLKDLVRTQAVHGIRTEIHSSLDATGCSTGLVRLIRKDETRNLYRKRLPTLLFSCLTLTFRADYLTSILIENRRLRVHLYDQSVPDRNGCICCNCGLDPSPTCPRLKRSCGPAPGAFQSISAASPMLGNMGRPMMNAPFAEPVPTAFPPGVSMPVQQHIPRADQGPLTMAMSRMNLDPYASDHAGYVRQMFPPPAQVQPSNHIGMPYPMYMQSATGTPVNAAHGVVKTEARGVFVSGLKYKATTSEVREFFNQVGDVVKVDLHKDPKTKKSKGYATILYANVETAQRAIEVFDQADFMGMSLKVRLDKETTAIGATFPASKAGRAKCPLIVNGTGGGAERLRQDSPLASD